jgi:hypothetical protein
MNLFTLIKAPKEYPYPHNPSDLPILTEVLSNCRLTPSPVNLGRAAAAQKNVLAGPFHEDFPMGPEDFENRSRRFSVAEVRGVMRVSGLASEHLQDLFQIPATINAELLDRFIRPHLAAFNYYMFHAMPLINRGHVQTKEDHVYYAHEFLKGYLIK